MTSFTHRVQGVGTPVGNNPRCTYMKICPGKAGEHQQWGQSSFPYRVEQFFSVFFIVLICMCELLDSQDILLQSFAVYPLVYVFISLLEVAAETASSVFFLTHLLVTWTLAHLPLQRHPAPFVVHCSKPLSQREQLPGRQPKTWSSLLAQQGAVAGRCCCELEKLDGDVGFLGSIEVL